MNAFIQNMAEKLVYKEDYNSLEEISSDNEFIAFLERNKLEDLVGPEVPPHKIREKYNIYLFAKEAAGEIKEWMDQKTGGDFKGLPVEVPEYSLEHLEKVALKTGGRERIEKILEKIKKEQKAKEKIEDKQRRLEVKIGLEDDERDKQIEMLERAVKASEESPLWRNIAGFFAKSLRTEKHRDSLSEVKAELDVGATSIHSRLQELKKGKEKDLEYKEKKKILEEETMRFQDLKDTCEAYFREVYQKLNHAIRSLVEKPEPEAVKAAEIYEQVIGRSHRGADYDNNIEITETEMKRLVKAEVEEKVTAKLEEFDAGEKGVIKNMAANFKEIIGTSQMAKRELVNILEISFRDAGQSLGKRYIIGQLINKFRK